ncbi:pantetheine-phosphate adenylyltransferase [Spirochaetia bacterium 38H-sp]|uniref:Phosphopantetheine adenylyltransferase n=1 Tax=Rarispira pelagica TaxID=3141764 RepID=A0ABU9UAT0_9SPIR
MKKAIYPGTFDPPTYGHINVIERIACIFETVTILIAANPSKNRLFSKQERHDFMSRLTERFSNVIVDTWDGLVVDYARQKDIRVIVRGVRALGDFNHEFELAMLNKGLNPEIETLFIPTDPRYFVLRSSTIKEIVSFGGDVSNLVPDFIEQELRKKLL